MAAATNPGVIDDTAGSRIRFGASYLGGTKPLWRRAPRATSSASLAGEAVGITYAISLDDDLLWYRHDGRNDGTFRWAFNEGRKVGNGWNFKQVFSGGDGVIYAITQSNDLLWYRHDGHGDGTFRWAFNDGKKVGNGWSFKQVFSGNTLAF
jgi:hypothetical protein